MFAEDVGLLPKGADGSGSFLALLQVHREQSATLVNMLRVRSVSMTLRHLAS